jgi:hypothetical protein
LLGFSATDASGTRLPRSRNAKIAAAAGIVLALVLFAASYLAASMGLDVLSYCLYWQAWVLEKALPCVPFGEWGLLCENVAVARILFWAALPVGALVYAGLVFAGLHFSGRRPAPPAAAEPPLPPADDRA